MAIKLQNKTNVTAPGGNFPYGDIKDDSGSNNGTPVNRAVYGDFHQFFARIMDIGGVVYNNAVENSANGFQYVTALIAIIVAQATTLVSAEAALRTSADNTLQSNITSEASTRGAADTTLQNNINGKLATGNVAPDGTTVEVVAGVLRAKDTQQVTGNTTVGAGSTTVLTLSTTNNTNLLVKLRLVSKYSGSGGTPGNGGAMERVYSFNNVSGTVTQIDTATIYDVSTGGSGQEVICTISGTDILIQIKNQTAGPIASCKVTVFTDSI